MTDYDKMIEEINYSEYIKKVRWLNQRTKEYDKGQPTVSDKEWDDVYFEVQSWEDSHPDMISSESPTQKITSLPIIVSELKKVKHNHPMLSLAKTKDIEEVKKFIGDKDYVVMAKMDGLTCSLTYGDGKLVRAETRGNGEVGEDITHNALVIPSIPKEIDYKYPVTIDGEIICTYNDFEEFKDEYKNPRNFASGSIRLLDSRECAKRNLTFVAWDTNYNSFTLWDKFIFLLSLHFHVVPHSIGVKNKLDQVETLMNITKVDATTRYYPIDGLVFKYNRCDEYEAAGRTDHHFKGGLAYKFYDEQYETTLKDIEWSMGRTGVLTPVAIFDSIDIDGSECSRASLHNLSVLNETLGVHPYVGQKITVYKANEIIPQIGSADKDEANIDWKHLIKMTCCPICGEHLEVKDNDGVMTVWCVNPQCEGKLINILDHFVGRKGLDIKGLSKKTLEKLIDWGWVNDITDIPKLKDHRAEWINKSGFGEASVDKILKSIDDALAEAPLHAFISGLGIPLVGVRVAKQICEHVETWRDFRDLIHEEYDFTQWSGFGYEMNSALHKYDYSKADAIVDYITFKPEEHQDKTVKFDSTTFVITGKLINFKNRQELVDLIENAGGKVQSAVSAKTMYLINNDVNSTSSKNKKAKELNIPIITEEELMEILK